MKISLKGRVLEPKYGSPLLMGVVNATPDSFSDRDPNRTVEQRTALALELVEHGADIIDVGGESGVTYRGAVTVEQEIERVLPLVTKLVSLGVTVSVDTWRAPVARAVVEAGAAMINDVSGLLEPEIATVCAESGAGLVIMHTRAKPKQVHFPGYDDVAADAIDFLYERLSVATQLGVDSKQIVLDPGPDFAKTPTETVDLLRRIEPIEQLGYPLLWAISRKYFIGVITGREPDDRLAGTLAAAGYAADRGAAILRVHDVREVADYLAVRRVLSGQAEVPSFDPDNERLKWIKR